MTGEIQVVKLCATYPIPLGDSPTPNPAQARGLAFAKSQGATVGETVSFPGGYCIMVTDDKTRRDFSAYDDYLAGMNNPTGGPGEPLPIAA